MSSFLAGLPDILAARTLNEVAEEIAKARLHGKAVVRGKGFVVRSFRAILG